MNFQPSQYSATLRCFVIRAAITTLLLGGCVQDSDFQKYKQKDVGGWTYLKSNVSESSSNSSSASILPKNENGNFAHVKFECHNNSRLQLLIETFRDNINQENPIKMRYAHSAFGRFLVADIKAVDNQKKLSLVAYGVNQNTIRLTLYPEELKLEKHLSSPHLILHIPTMNNQTDAVIELDNQNIQKAFNDCGYMPAFMVTEKAH